MSRHVQYSLKLLPFVCGIFLVLFLNRMENWAYPVVKDFTVTSVDRTGNKLDVSGYMRKVRACRFAGVTAEGFTADESEAVELPLKFRDSHADETASRPTGTQSWGPWQLEIPLLPHVHTIRLTAVHRCHPAWPTQTYLVTIPAVPPPDLGV